MSETPVKTAEPTIPNELLPLVHRMIEQAVNEKTAGLTKNRDQILAEKKALEGKANPFLSLGVDPDVAERAVEFVKRHDFQKLMQTGDVDKLRAEIEKDVGTRAEKQWKDRVAKEEAEKADAIKREGVLKGELRKLNVTDRLRRAALAGGVRQDAVDVAVMMGEKLFDLDEAGQCVAFKDGQPVPGKSGWLTPEEWVTEDLLVKAAYLRAQTTGPGSPGSTQQAVIAGQKRYTRAQFDALPYRQQSAVGLAAARGEIEIID